MKEIKELLIQVVTTMLYKGKDPCKLTVRQIAKKAETTPGLINYHFGSKDQLIQIAIGQMMKADIQHSRPDINSGISPKQALIKVLQKNADWGILGYPIMKYIIQKRLLM